MGVPSMTVPVIPGSTRHNVMLTKLFLPQALPDTAVWEYKDENEKGDVWRKYTDENGNPIDAQLTVLYNRNFRKSIAQMRRNDEVVTTTEFQASLTFENFTTKNMPLRLLMSWHQGKIYVREGFRIKFKKRKSRIWSECRLLGTERFPPRPNGIRRELRKDDIVHLDYAGMALPYSSFYVYDGDIGRIAKDVPNENGDLIVDWGNQTSDKKGKINPSLLRRHYVSGYQLPLPRTVIRPVPSTVMGKDCPRSREPAYTWIRCNGEKIQVRNENIEVGGFKRSEIKNDSISKGQSTHRSVRVRFESNDEIWNTDGIAPPGIPDGRWRYFDRFGDGSIWKMFSDADQDYLDGLSLWDSLDPFSEYPNPDFKVFGKSGKFTLCHTVNGMSLRNPDIEKNKPGYEFLLRRRDLPKASL